MTSHKPNPWDGEALLARLHNDHVHKFVVRTEDKLREHFAGEIAAARARGLAPVFNFEPGEMTRTNWSSPRQYRRSAASTAQAIARKGVRGRTQGWCRSRHRRRLYRVLAVCGCAVSIPNGRHE